MERRNVRLSTRDSFAHVTLARPERRNTLSFETIAELDAVFAEIGAGKARGVLLDAEGPVFSAGHDFATWRAATSRACARCSCAARR
jgi:enoyl-CoA hydratase/carnithine racemase